MFAVQAIRPGGPEVLHRCELERPSPGPGEVLVEVRAAGVNYIDTYRRSGLYPMPYPHTVGVEGAGVVAALGEGVTGVELGARVAWHDAHGSYAEYVTVSAEMLVPIPEGVDFTTAAAVLLQGLTAHYLVTGSHVVEPGQTALVHAAAGGVGLLLTQFVKHRGGRVIGTVSTPEKAELARQAGADDVFCYGAGVDVRAEVMERTGGRGVDVAYDGVGKDTFDASLASIRPLGSMVLYGAASGPVPPFDIQRLNSSGGIFLSRPSLAWFVPTAEVLRERAAELFAGLAEGWLRFRVGHTFPLAEARRAHEALESRQTTGKVVLTVG